MTISDPNRAAPVFADMLQAMASLANDLVCEHKAVKFLIAFGSKTALVLGAEIPISEGNSIEVVKSMKAKAAVHGYTVDGNAGYEADTPYGKVRQFAFTMRHFAEEPTVQ